MTEHAEKIAAISESIQQIATCPEEAADIAIDAAAMLIAEHGLDAPELCQRLYESHGTMKAALDHIKAFSSMSGGVQ